MKSALRILCLLLLACRPLLAAGPADQFAAIKAQIDALLECRRQPPPFHPEVDNPFKRPGNAGGELVPTAPGGGPATPRPPVTVDLIHRLGAQLRISGTVFVGGQLQAIINSTPCEEGRILAVRDGDMLYRLLIKKITATTITIQLGDDELTLPIR